MRDERCTIMAWQSRTQGNRPKKSETGLVRKDTEDFENKRK